jgi:RNAse (barnase) inhibitor barstar
MSAKHIYEIDGKDFLTLEEFYEVFGQTLIPKANWGRNLDAFNDILRGGFGTPEGGYILRWRNSEISRQRLGYFETARQLKRRLASCHPQNQDSVAAELKAATAGTGPTVFDWLVEIIQEHCAGGSEEEDGVELELI